MLSHFCNVNKSIKSKDKNKVFSPRSGVVYSPGWRQKFFFLPDKAPINLRFNQNIQGLLLFNKVFLVVLEDFHKKENSKDFVVKNYLYCFCSYVIIIIWFYLNSTGFTNGLKVTSDLLRSDFLRLKYNQKMVVNLQLAFDDKKSLF